MQSATLLGIALALGSMLLFACVVIATSIASRKLSSDAGALLATIANVPVGLCFLALQWLFAGPLRPPHLPGLLGFILAGIFATFIGRWLFFRAVELLGPSRASGFQSASPVATALLGWLLLGEHIGPLGLMGMLLGILGLGAISQGAGAGRTSAAARPRPQAPHDPGLPRSVGASALRTVLLIGVGSATAYAASHILRAAAVRSWNEPLAGATLGAIAGLVAMLVVSRRRLRPIAASVRLQPGSARLYCLIGAMQLSAQALMIASMRHIPASYAALISMSSPLIVMPVSHFLLRNDESLTRTSIAGILLTIAGVAVLSFN